MQCLRCSNDALQGKALCASCFADHQKKVEFEETDEWVKQQLEATRSESRDRQRDSSGSETSPQSLILTLAPALLALGGFVMLSVWAMRNYSFSFTPTPESEQVEGVPVASSNKGAPAGKVGSSAPGRLSGSTRSAAGRDDSESAQLQTPPTPTPLPTPTSTPIPTTTPEGTVTPDSTPTP